MSLEPGITMQAEPGSRQRGSESLDDPTLEEAGAAGGLFPFIISMPSPSLPARQKPGMNGGCRPIIGNGPTA
jgi:hypothetical protein